MPNIEVLTAYSGVLTNGRIIYPGVYAEDDAQIVRAASVMIAKGFAVPTLKPLPEPVANAAQENDIPFDDYDPDDVIGSEEREDVFVLDTGDLDEVEEADEDGIEDESYDYDEVEWDTMTLEELRGAVEERGLADAVIGTGVNGRILKRDYIVVLTAQG